MKKQKKAQKEKIQKPIKLGPILKNSRESLSDSDKEIFDSIILSLTQDAKQASDYSNRRCSQCTGKGYYQRNYILPKGHIRVDLDKNQYRYTEPETMICGCIEKNLVHAILETPTMEAITIE